MSMFGDQTVQSGPCDIAGTKTILTECGNILGLRRLADHVLRLSQRRPASAGRMKTTELTVTDEIQRGATQNLTLKDQMRRPHIAGPDSDGPP